MLVQSCQVAATQCDEEMWAYVCSAAVSRRLVLKRPADFPSSACCGQWGIEISRVWLLNFRQLCANLTRLVDLADPEKKRLFRSRARRCLNSAHSDWLRVSLSWLVLFMVCLLRSWCWSMALGQPICLEAKKSAERREDYIYIWTETYIIGFLYICRKHITISPYDYTHAQPRTHVHTHICTQTRTTWTQHMYIITTSQSKTSLDAHATRSVCLRAHTFKILPPNLTPHENNITSHTHIHIRIASACTSRILQTASYTRYTYR